MATKNGIEYNLFSSQYKCTWREWEFYFSSPMHLKNFSTKIEARIDWLNDSLSRRFHFTVESDCIAVMQLYCQVETRGFLVRDVKEDRWYDCRESIELRGTRIKGKS